MLTRLDQSGYARDGVTDESTQGGVAAAVLALTIAGPTAGAALGEVTGSGKGGPNGDGSSPVASFQAGSICAFSGLNDNPAGEAGDPFSPGKVQNWGDVVVQAKNGMLGPGLGASEIAPVIHDEGPGTNCRGFASTH